MMKAIVMALAALPFTARAQNPAELSPGVVELAGDATLRLSKGSTEVKPDLPGASSVKTDTGDYELDAAGFYYVTSNVGLGLSLSFQKGTAAAGPEDERTQLLVLGPALSLHVPIAPSLAVFTRGTLGYARSRSWGSELPDLEGTGYGYSVQAGVQYFPIPQISLNLGVEYGYARLTTDEVTMPMETIPKLVATSSDLSGFAGLSVYFGR